MLNLAVLISGEGTNLQEIIDHCEKGTLNAVVKAVISNNPNANGLGRAKKHNINTYLSNNDRELITHLEKVNADLIVCAGWLKVLSNAVLEAFPNKIINLHPALPGSHIGLNCIKKAWDNRLNVNSSGVMIHWVTQELDRGDYINVQRVPIYRTDNYEDFESRMRTAEKQVLINTIRMIQETSYVGNNISKGEKYEHVYSGKVREVYDLHNDLLAIEHTDRLSSFDRHICDVPGKGHILTETSAFWFSRIDIPNHYVFSEGNTMIVKKCTVIPIEVVVRGYITGSTQTSLWTHYKKGTRNYCGVKFPDGLVKNQKLERNVITPTTKAEVDELITPKEIVERGIVNQEEWEYISKQALRLFNMGQMYADSRGLILVDTKYEFGRDSNGKILLIDEVHTCDSSRYWLQKSYESRMSENKEPEKYDKDIIRDYVKKNVKDPYKKKTFNIPKTVVKKTYDTYLKFFNVLTESELEASDCNMERIINYYLTNIDWIYRPHLVILSGSESDKDHVKKIEEHAKKYNIQTKSHVASAHKNTRKVLSILDFYNSRPGQVIFVCVAGRSNALGGVVACNTDYPTIACPPFKDKMDMTVNINSTLQCPSKVPVMTVLEPINVAMCARKIFNL